MPKRKNKTKKIKKKEEILGFGDIPENEKSIWRIDNFGKRKVIDADTYLIRTYIDNKGLATDFKKNTKKFKLASTEFKRRLYLQIKLSPSSKRLFLRKIKKNYSLDKIKKKIDSMSIEKIQKMYLILLKSQKLKKSRKK
tara:strand:- start:2216 stop:2632 length:417 start_codon:yes stop_codon:yes gene_type:complete